jgi:hypothetical protein
LEEEAIKDRRDNPISPSGRLESIYNSNELNDNEIFRHLDSEYWWLAKWWEPSSDDREEPSDKSRNKPELGRRKEINSMNRSIRKEPFIDFM